MHNPNPPTQQVAIKSGKDAFDRVAEPQPIRAKRLECEVFPRFCVAWKVRSSSRRMSVPTYQSSRRTRDRFLIAFLVRLFMRFRSKAMTSLLTGLHRLHNEPPGANGRHASCSRFESL
jgi:hypothetical protein